MQLQSTNPDSTCANLDSSTGHHQPFFDGNTSTISTESDSFCTNNTLYSKNVQKLLDLRSWSTDNISIAKASRAAADNISIASLLPAISGHVDKVIYQNLVEMIPLVQNLMDQQNAKTFVSWNSLVCAAATPARDTFLLKKAGDNPVKGRMGLGYWLKRRRPRVRSNGMVWDNDENALYSDNQESCLEDIPMLSFPTENQVEHDRDGDGKATILQLETEIEELQQKLLEKDSQLQDTERRQRDDRLHLQKKVEDLHKQISIKEQELQILVRQLSETQAEIAELNASLEKAEDEVNALNLNAVKAREDLHRLRYQVAEFLFQIQSIFSCIENGEVQLQALAGSSSKAPSPETDSMDNGDAASIKMQSPDHTRSQYIESLRAARENPSEELLSLIAQLREQLQASLIS